MLNFPTAAIRPVACFSSLALPEAQTWQLTWQMHSIWLGFINHGKYSAIAELPSAVLVS